MMPTNAGVDSPNAPPPRLIATPQDISVKFDKVQRQQQQMQEVIVNQQQTMARQHKVISCMPGFHCVDGGRRWWYLSEE